MIYKYIFFDLDRTLWDYNSNAKSALELIYNTYKLNLHFSSHDEFITLYNHYNDLLWDDYRKGKLSKEKLRIERFNLVLKHKSIDNTELASIIDKQYLDITPRYNILFPNSIEVLEYLTAAGYQLYILTNGFISTQDDKLRNSRIDHYFLKVFSSEEIGINKPRTEFFQWAVTCLNAKKKECLMVGDDLEVDIKGAHRYNIDTVWFNPENISSDFNPTYEIQNLIQLKELL